MFAVVVEFTIKPEHADAFLQLMKENASASLRTEPGCKQFDVATDASRPGEVFLYELYTDAAAFEAHLKTAHFASFDATTIHMIAAKVVKTYDRVTQ